jgi:hypothetical protein
LSPWMPPLLHSIGSFLKQPDFFNFPSNFQFLDSPNDV